MGVSILVLRSESGGKFDGLFKSIPQADLILAGRTRVTQKKNLTMYLQSLVKIAILAH